MPNSSDNNRYLAKETVEGIVLPAKVVELRQRVNQEGQTVTRLVVEFCEECDDYLAIVAKYAGAGKIVQLVAASKSRISF